MHYSVLAIIDRPDVIDKESIEAEVEGIMRRHGDGDKWDWYQIGGRWSGVLDGYDPETDQKNIVTCNLCGGTGKRPDMAVMNGCNGCRGTGKHVEWPTQWGFREGDCKPVAELTQEELDKFYAVCDGSWFGGKDYVPWAVKPDGTADYDAMFPRREMPPLDWLKREYAGKLAVVVDCHN